MLWASSLPQRYWGDAVTYASYIRNRVSTRANADYKSPLEVLTGKTPRVSHILRFGSKCTVHIHRKTARSLGKRAEKAVVVGISTTEKGYVLFLPRTKRFTTSPDIQNVDKLDIQHPETAEVLHRLHGEDNTPTRLTTENSGEANQQTNPSPEDEDSDEEGVHEDFGRPIPAGVLRRVFGRRKSDKPTEFQLPRSFTDAFAGPAYALLSIRASDHIKEPKTLGEAKRSQYWQQWKEAMDQELADLQANGTWELVETPKNANLVTSKWVYKIKFSSKGELERFKARLVARGFTQKFGVDFDATFSPVLKLSSLRFIVMLAAIWKANLLQGDVPNAYLKSDLDKPIILRPPVGTPGVDDRHSWLLRKGLYGLKQSGKLWNDLIDSFLKAEGFSRSKMDPCIYFMHCDGNLCVLGLYVDDVLVVSQDENLSEHVMSRLSERFNIKNLGEAQKCLGVWIKRNPSGIILHQQQTIEELLEKFGMGQCRPATTPMEENHQFFEDDVEPFTDTNMVREAIGSLLWISNCTRPDITTAVNCLSRFVAHPTVIHWRGIKRVLRYLKGTVSHGLSYKFGNGPGTPLHVTEYSDANWAGDSKSAKSTSGAVLQVNSMTISWASRKQTTVALSTMEAEYVAACAAVQDCIGIRQLLGELHLLPKNSSILLRVDNQSAIKSMENAVSSQRTRHLNIKYHFVRDAITNKDVKVEYCPSQQQLADLLTKATDKIVFRRLCDMLRLQCFAHGGVLQE
ncbi:Integrase, catalytic core protein [Phytophthora megakarya]|uniref:Integrase, catalytic core protein n=1 Tax=Phytophthora megakarya TaxID=4795 RepID=A0A225VMT5_9STRA|nr:Integrase, catalytic core protein [Phytophthora megakarya]